MRKDKRKQLGQQFGENLAKLGLEKGSRAINSTIGKKINK